jgi:hypothetical protein
MRRPSARRILILAHRYLGVPLSMLFLIWFVSGIVMIYSQGMPQLTTAERRRRMPALNESKVRLTPSDALARAGMRPSVRQLSLLTLMERPAYRFVLDRPVIVFADTGEVLTRLSTTDALAIASQFMDVGIGRLRHVAVLAAPDQWTIGLRRQLPLHKIAVHDDVHTQLYVSEQWNEVVMRTTRRSRIAAWLGAIPHWLYFTPLRVHDVAWRQIVLWTSGLGTLLVALGLILAVIQFAFRPPFTPARILSYVPYAGWMRWHYITGALFGVFTLTWVFSGMLSMQPFNWASGDIDENDVSRALSGGGLDSTLLESTDLHRAAASFGGAVREIELRRIQDKPYYLVWRSAETPVLLEGSSLQERRSAFSTASLVQRLELRYPAVPIVSSDMLLDYDSYYYSRDRSLPLPVLRIKLGDPQRSWIYIDPRLAQPMLAISRRGRVERWIYHGFHSLDFSFWYYRRPLWDLALVMLSLGGATLSAIGVVIGVRRVVRFVRR